MKTAQQIEDKMENVDPDMPSKYPAMTYEQGVREALMWVLGEIDDDEFQP